MLLRSRVLPRGTLPVRREPSRRCLPRHIMHKHILQPQLQPVFLQLRQPIKRWLVTVERVGPAKARCVMVVRPRRGRRILLFETIAWPSGVLLVAEQYARMNLVLVECPFLRGDEPKHGREQPAERTSAKRLLDNV